MNMNPKLYDKIYKELSKLVIDGRDDYWLKHRIKDGFETPWQRLSDVFNSGLNKESDIVKVKDDYGNETEWLSVSYELTAASERLANEHDSLLDKGKVNG